MTTLVTAGARLGERIADRTARIGVLGIGYVGLPLCVEFARSGFEVVGLDVARDRVAALNAGDSYIEDTPSADLRPLLASGKLRATSDFDVIAELDAAIICVPTPLRKTRDPDVSYVVAAVREVARRAHRDMLVILESTTYPGTTEEILVPELEQRGFKPGEDIFVAFSGERIDPGNPRYALRNTPKVVGGLTQRCTELAFELYATAVDRVVVVSSPRAAEMVKLLENTFRAINIGLVNELAQVSRKIGIDVWEVIEAAATKPFGFMKFTPGPGLGGHCIPIDPLYLSWKVKERNTTARFIELADDVNSHMPDYVVQRAVLALNDARKCMNGARVLLLGVAYKRDIGDVRESPAIPVLKGLEALGARVDYHDPYVRTLAHEGIPARSISDAPTPDVRAYDLVIVITDHACVDYDRVVREARLVLDCRNACATVLDGRERVVKL